MLCFKNSNIVHTQNDMTLSLDYNLFKLFRLQFFAHFLTTINLLSD